MTGHYRGALPGFPREPGRDFALNYEIVAKACSKRRARCAGCNDALRKPYNTGFETSWRSRHFQGVFTWRS
jgi:hypothetical protein